MRNRPIYDLKMTLLVGFLLMLVVNPTSAQDSPEGVVSAFLDAWNTVNYGEMYRYVHPTSQQQFPQPVFEARYTAAHQVMAFAGLRHTIQNTRIQGQSAAVTYSVQIESGAMGTIEETGRTMRLVQTPNGWRIAWSSMDIFDTLVGDAVLNIQSVPQPRGTIYDRNGLILAEDGGTTVALYSSQGNMFEVNDCLNLLGELTLESVPNLQQNFANRTPENVFFLTEMHTDEYNANRVDLQEICGVDPETQVFESRPHREYYGRSAMSHTLGYIGPIPQEELPQYQQRGYSVNDLVGLSGVEFAFQDELAGKPERVLNIIDSSGQPLREITRTEGEPSVSVTVSLDRDIQMSTAQAISDAFNYARGNWGDPTISPGGAAVVLDVNTGEILALTSYPLIDPYLFNPNATSIENRGILLQQLIADPRGPLRNRATNEQQSPGSVFKIITLAAILNEGLTTPDEIFFCDLYWDGRQYGDTLEQRADWRVADEMEAAGDITPAQALMSSCNPFFWQYGAALYRQVGSSTIVDYSRRLGLGRVYGLQALPEIPGSIEVPASTEAAINEAVGQGNVALPPIQMAVATAAIANGGMVHTPQLVKLVGGRDGNPPIASFAPIEPASAELAPEVIEAVQEGMCGVTTSEEYGTAYIRFGDPTEEFHIMAPYSVCGKTGTAQTARYPNAWFVAYAPADDPQLAIVVMVEQSLEGSQVAAPIARRILDDYFNAPRAEFPWWWGNESYVPLNIPEGGGAG